MLHRFFLPTSRRNRVRRRLPVVLLALAVVCFFGWRVHRAKIAAAVRSAATARSLRGITVVLDPGHGGTDSGARVGSAREDVLNYRLTSTVAARLRERGATVVYTVASRALIDNLPEDRAEPPLIQPSDATLLFNGDPVRFRADRDPADLYRRAAIAARVWRALPTTQRETGCGLYFLALHCDQLPGSTGRGRESISTAAVADHRVLPSSSSAA